MAIAITQDWIEQETDRSTANYDAISAKVDLQDSPPQGLLAHSAGFTGRGFRVFDVWESLEDYERFEQQRLLPLVAEVAGPDATPPQVTMYELHHLVIPGAAPAHSRG